MRPLVKYVLVFFIFFLVTGSGAYFAVMLVTQSAQEIILPELKGKNIIYVLETLTNMGLNAKLHGTKYDDMLPKYHVISQDPEPGSTIKKGRDVVIYISKGKKENIMPHLKQIPLNEAVLILEEKEFKLNKISRAFSNTTPMDSVIAQYPEAFMLSAKGSLCNLLISSGPKPVKYLMPDLIGSTLTEAVTKIETGNLDLDKIEYKYSSLLAEDIISNQFPKPGAHVLKDQKISIVVNTSHQTQKLSIDDLTGLIGVRYRLKPGFLNRHVKIYAKLFGSNIELYNQYAEPGKEIMVVVPAGIKTKINIFIDDQLIKTRIIDPWNLKKYSGELLWE